MADILWQLLVFLQLFEKDADKKSKERLKYRTQDLCDLIKLKDFNLAQL